MDVICLEDPAFYALIETVVKRLSEKNNITQDKWISGAEAMKKLNITSKSTLQKYRDQGSIRFSQPDKKIILYDLDSIYAFLDKNSHDTF